MVSEVRQKVTTDHTEKTDKRSRTLRAEFDSRTPSRPERESFDDPPDPCHRCDPWFESHESCIASGRDAHRPPTPATTICYPGMNRAKTNDRWWASVQVCAICPKRRAALAQARFLSRARGRDRAGKELVLSAALEPVGKPPELEFTVIATEHDVPGVGQEGRVDDPAAHAAERVEHTPVGVIEP